MFWLFFYRTLVTGFFLICLPIVVIVCLCVSKWREGIEHKLGLIDRETIYQIRKSRFNDLLGQLKEALKKSEFVEQPHPPPQIFREHLPLDKGRCKKEKVPCQENDSWDLGVDQNFLKEGDLDLPENKLSKNIWLHAVSFGEVKTVEPFIYELQMKYPDHTICLSTGTRTGQDLAKKLFTNTEKNQRLKKQCVIFYCPFDFYFAVKNWFTVIKPKMLIIVETEIWPELLCQAKLNSVPAFLINARLTDKSVSKYSWLNPLMVEVMKCFKKICAQSEKDKQRFISVGAKQEQLQIVGNLKFDSMQTISKEEVDDLREQLNIQKNTFTLIAGSTHNGEEDLACKVYKNLQKEFPDKDIRLIIAPRHLERMSEVEKICKENDLCYLKRSNIKFPKILEGNRTVQGFGNSEVLILDTLGELTKFYGVANVAMLGGTWAKIGGHNPLEPIAYGIPVIVGPYTFKIDDLIEQLGDNVKRAELLKNILDILKIYISNTKIHKHSSNTLYKGSISATLCDLLAC